MSLRSHARQRLSRLTACGFLSGVLLGAAACRSTFHEVPVYKDGPVRVSLRSSAKDGGRSPTRYEHPATLSSERLEKILAAVGVEEHSFFAWRDEGALLAGEDAAQLAPKLADSLRKARADQWVYFSVRNTPKRMTFGAVRFSDGIAFVKDGKLNLVFDNIGYVENVDIPPSRMDPRDAKTSQNVRLAAKSPDALGAAPPLVPGDRWLGRERTNWLVFDLAPAAAPAPQPQAVATTPAAPPVAPAAATTPPAVGAPAAAAPAGVSAAPSAPAPAAPDPEERLRKLKDLRDKGLITPEEYENKRQEILKGL
jgi:hypothetical protein